MRLHWKQRLPWIGLVVLLTITGIVFIHFPRQNVQASTSITATYMGNNARTGYNAAETFINPTTAPNLKLRWTAQTAGHISDQPIQVNGVVYWGSWDGLMHATNATTGQDNWATQLGTKIGSCGKQSFGIQGTATISTVNINGTATQTVFVAGGQDNLYALNANTGSILWQTNLGNSTAELIYGSPALYNGSVYIGVSSSGDCPLVQGVIYQVSATSGTIQHTFDFVPNGCIGAGIWSAPAIDESTGMLYIGTGNADPINCLNTEPLGSALVELNASNLTQVSAWQFTSNGATDNDIGSTPTLFNATIGGSSRAMVGLESKDGNFYAFDRTNISAGPLWKVTVSAGGGNPVTGGSSISTSAYDGSKLYVAGGTTTINGNSCQGGLRALDPNTGKFLWEACLNGPVLGGVIVVPGLVAVGAGTTLVVVNAATGTTLFSYQDTTTNAKLWGSPSISNGVLYMGSRSGHLFAFWLGGLPPSPTPSSSPTPSPSPTLTPSPTTTPSPGPSPSPTPNPGNAPTNKTWYFAEGKVGDGFTEYLTIENPDPINDCSVNIQYLLGTGSPLDTPITVPHASRFTVSVNSDLNTPANASAYQTDSAIVSVTNPTTCAGVVAERPMYFTNFAGVSSGSDVLGATHTGTNFYFADVPTGGGYASFLTILNPGNTTATVTATFVVGGSTISSQTQTIQVAGGTRGTIIPNNSGALLHAAVTVTSSQPVVVERPTYFNHLNAGNAQTVSGASSVVGVQALQKEWLFAEGYTGSGFQENFVLANFGTTVVTANVKLEFSNGHTETIAESIQPSDQTMVNVNAIVAGNLGSCDTSPCQPTQDVSADITGNASFIAQREMYFQYTHIANGRSLSAMGGTDVIGEGVTGSTAYSFAEGYTNLGYDEWLTLQNPTATTETIGLTLVNEEGRTFKQQFTLVAHSRFTLDITNLVLQTLITPNDSFQGYEVSLVAQSGTGAFVAERPMYWNTGASGTQGGSDILGYIGN